MNETNPFLPIVTDEEVFNFDPADQSTYTRSRLVNAVLTAYKEKDLRQAKEIAKYLEIGELELQKGLWLEYRHTFTEMRQKIVRHLYEKVEAEHPGWNSDEKARAVGLADHSSLWHFLHPEYKKQYDRR